MSILEFEQKIAEIENRLSEMSSENTGEIEELQQQLNRYKNRAYEQLTAWDHVVLARHPKRPKARDYIDYIFDSFVELHGDRVYGDDASIIGGIAKLGNQTVTVIAHQKGNTTAENIACNFGMPHPEGYRKALRLMKQAEKFKRPIITFIDTPGAYPGLQAEERGQGHAIAQCLRDMSDLKTPTLSIVIGEGGSGGALALGVTDQIWMLQYAIYSILSPEGFAAILYKDGSKSREAAQVMKLTAQDYLDMGIIDRMIKEPIGGAHQFPQYVFDHLKEDLTEYLNSMKKVSIRQLQGQRYKKYRMIGEYELAARKLVD
ncbi:MAG: acetyl-CoA carboxylase carboxyltransferase subunit alpha [Turicibacter sp.]